MLKLVPSVLLVPMEEAENGIACATGSLGSDVNTWLACATGSTASDGKILLAGKAPLTGN